MKNLNNTCNRLPNGNRASAETSKSNGLKRTMKRAVLAFCCAGLMMSMSSCSRQSGCGTWGKIKAKPTNKQYACYNKFKTY